MGKACYYNIGIAYKNAEYYLDALDALWPTRENASAEKIETGAMKRIVVCRDAIGKKG